MNRMIFEGLLKEREERVAAIRDAACRLRGGCLRFGVVTDAGYDVFTQSTHEMVVI